MPRADAWAFAHMTGHMLTGGDAPRKHFTSRPCDRDTRGSRRAVRGSIRPEHDRQPQPRRALRPPRAALDPLSLVLHLGFGAAAGALRAALAPRSSGVAFGLGVWAASYAGWAPALGLMPPPTRDRPGRPATMIIAHVIYG